MFNLQSLALKPIQSLVVSGLVMTSLVGFSSVAFSKDVQTTSPETQTQENTKNSVQDSTQTNGWPFCPLARPCD